MMTMLLV